MTVRTFLVLLALTCSAFSQSATDSEKATIYIYRANQFVAKLKSPTVYCDESALAKMQNGRFFKIKLSPGRYAFRSEDKGVGIQLQPEAGKEYFIRIEMAVGTLKATQQVVEVSSEQGLSEIRRLKPIDRNKIIDQEKVLLE